MTMNPYAAPQTDVAADATAAAPPPKSFARRLSFFLAGVGFVGFWGPMGAIASGTDNALVELAGGLAMLFAMVANFMGMVIMFAAPRGRRLLPVLLNAVCLAIIVSVVVLGLVVGKE